MLRVTAYVDHIMIAAIYVPDLRALKCRKQKLIALKEEMDKYTIIVEYFKEGPRWRRSRRTLFQLVS